MTNETPMKAPKHDPIKAAQATIRRLRRMGELSDGDGTHWDYGVMDAVHAMQLPSSVRLAGGLTRLSVHEQGVTP